MRVLVVVDFQKDFVDGALGFPEAAALEGPIEAKVGEYVANGDMVVFTKDMHDADRYPETQEGRRLPVPHCIDEDGDLMAAQDEGTIDYILELKKQGVVRRVGMSTHTPETAQKALDLGILDMLMFSINPAYDYVKGEYGIGSVASRMELYRRCGREGVGISVMKPFAAGQLLDAAVSPFGRALTTYQCIQYALDKPGVITVLPGVRGRDDLRGVLGFFDADESERDYSVIGEFAPAEAEGRCVYCNHCQPCPAGINVGLVNKYYDLAKAGDGMARDHYRHLAAKASGCLQCGRCDSRCPFHVRQSARMAEIAAYFGL